ncbi:MAG: 4-(cytidine 5'-diphospho)-2-C-methyl-D-erythritol kinase [Clostridia bacterium]|nr:4-(cytidine 5'-diphospho)-2-C-methyl-D-erythritol kinase [Clostridia bacterium]
MENKKELTLLAPAKINVCLGVTGRRANGYHDIDSVMQTIGIYDKVSVTLTENAVGQKIDVVCKGHPELDGENDIAYGMAQIFFEYTKTENYEVFIEIEKVIPMEAGLGGGSSDAAAVVIALNELTGSRLTEAELMAIGAKVGADVPFLVHKGTAFVGGIGENITPCRNLPETQVLVAYPKTEKVSTGKAYAAIDAHGKFSPHEDFEKMKSAVENGDIAAISAASYNIFESVLPEGSAVFRIKAEMLRRGALMSLMSGSGSAVFGFFASQKAAESAAQALESEARTFVCRLCRKNESYAVK